MVKYRIDRTEIKEEAKDFLADNWVKLALMTFIYYGIVFIGIILLDEILQNLSLVLDILLLPMYAALIAAIINLVEGKKIKVISLFDFYYKNIGFGLKVSLALLISMILVILGLILFIIPGIIIMMGLAQVMFILFDEPKLKIIDAFKKSWTMMQGYKMDYFILNLSFLGWGILALLTFGIGLIWLIPYMLITYYLYYKKIKSANE